MKRLFLFFLLILFLVILGGVSYKVFSRKTALQSEKFAIDYPKFEELAKKHPVGGKLLDHIRENEKLLSDQDSANDVNAYLAIGFDMRQLGDDRAAISAYKEALRKDTKNTLALNNIATSYRELGEFKEAEQAYRKLIEASPGDASAYRNLADVYKYEYPEDEKGLVAIMNEGLKVVIEGKGDLVSYLGSYYEERGETQKAIEAWERFLELVPGNIAAEAELKKLKNIK